MNEKAMYVYRGVLAEIKYRIEAIDTITKGKVPLRMRIAEESCHLQLRMICELIAIGCLTIHGDLSAKKSDLLKTYKADWILKVLTGLHPSFYPEPLENQDMPSENGGPPAWISLKSGFLTKAELLDLYNKHTAPNLHRGSAKDIFKNEQNVKFDQIKLWRNKIVRLLNRHIIKSPDGKNIAYFIMSNQEGQVASNLFLQIH